MFTDEGNTTLKITEPCPQSCSRLDSGGGWHDVEGWQGSLDEVANGVWKKVWWAAQKDLGTGPFRWFVRQTDDGQPPSASEPFYLPQVAGETIHVEVLVTP